MKTFGGTYSVDGGQVLWRGHPIAGADATTFEPLNATWSRDAERVYRQNRRFKADRATFSVLSDIFAKDTNHVFEWEGPVKEADAATFEVLRPTDEVEDEDLCREYARDREHVFHKVMTVGKACLVRSADPESFRALGHGFGADRESVFHERSRLPRCDPASWRRLGLDYACDVRRVYIGNGEIPGADPATFQLLPSHGVGTWGRDARRFYQGRDAADPRPYRESLRQLTVFAGTIVRGEVIDQQRRIVEAPEATGDHGCRFTVRCDEVLNDPGVAAINRPQLRDLFHFMYFNGLVPIAPARLVGRAWIWFCYTSTWPGEDLPRLQPVLGWRTFWPASRRSDVVSLLTSRD